MNRGFAEWRNVTLARAIGAAALWAVATGSVCVCFGAANQTEAESEDCEPCHVTESFLVELPFIQEKGIFQATVSSQYNSGRSQQSLLFPFSLEYGITDSWQASIDWLGFGYSREEGQPVIRDTGELALSVRRSFAMKDKRNHLAAGFEITFPTGKLGGNSIEYRPSLMYGREFPTCHNLHVFGELALDCLQRIRNANDESTAHELFVGAGVLVPVNDFCVSSEITWNNNRWNHHGTLNEIYAAPGVTWRVNDTWQCGVAMPLGLNAQSDRFQVIGRIMFEF